jgi:hypothetical protein
MAVFNIRDETVHAAFETLEANAEPAAAAKAMRVMKEHELKQQQKAAFLMAEGNVAEREAQSMLTPEYNKALKAYRDAVEADEYYRNTKSKCEAIIECWRSCQATHRAMGKVG